MKINLRDNLLFTSLTLIHNDRQIIIDNIIIDTGAAQTLLSSDIAENIGIVYQNGDRIIRMFGIGGESIAFRKIVDEVKFGIISIKDYSLDFGYIDTRHGINGLIGLDLLLKVKAVIDLHSLEIILKG